MSEKNSPKYKDSQKSSSVFLSVIIPAQNEEESIEKTVQSVLQMFFASQVDDFEIVVVNDHSTDKTENVLQRITSVSPAVRYVNNENPAGFGFAVRAGLNHFCGDAVCIVMADLSDSPQDILTYYKELKSGAECVFGSRFIKGSKVIDYPKIKYALNRLVNVVIRILFGIQYNDTTNAFKAYRRMVIEGVKPLLSNNFNLTVELPLKAIVRGYSYRVVPISWTGRVYGVSKLKIKEMGSRYLFIILYALLEKWLSRKDYYRRNAQSD